MYAGVDIGGSTIKAGVVDRNGRVRARVSVPTPPDASGTIHAIRDLLRGFARIRAAGVGVPGPLDARRRTVLDAPNLRGWRGFPIARALRRHLGFPVVLENDANCAALGEYVYGAGRGMRSLVLFTLGTGVGGGIVLDGRLWIGNGAAGELGHLTIKADGPPCPCGNRGCLEQYASAPAIARAAGLPDGDAEPVFRARSQQADRAIRRAARALGIAVASLAHALHPDVFVVGGGVANSAARFLPEMRAEAARRVFPSVRAGLRVVPAGLGTDAGWRGAAELARRRKR